MRRIVIIVPGIVRGQDRESVLRQSRPALRSLAEAGTVSKLARLPDVTTPEALFLGMAPTEAQMPQGPLTVSALGADPPERSLHFHLSLMSLTDSVVSAAGDVTDEESRAVVERAVRLNTSKLTIVAGEKTDHALVLEALGDLGTTRASDAEGKAYREVLPQGDFDRLLRRFIDDSVNLLSDVEHNAPRIDEGRPPLNLLWPWGQGTRPRVPNLVLRRGEHATVESASMRMAGLTRLTGYAHVDRRLVGKGVDTKFGSLASCMLKRDVTIALLEAPVGDEELDWFVHEMDRSLLQPLIDSVTLTPTKITVLAPGEPFGLCLEAVLPSVTSNALPFDERTLDERRVPVRDLAGRVESGVLE